MREDQRMPLREHLDELRRTLVRCAVVYLALFVAGLVFEKQLLDFLWIPWRTTRADLVAAGLRDPGPLQYISAAEGMVTALKASFAAAALVGAPFYLWELWRFIGVGLVEKERRAIRRAFFPGLVLMVAGLGFGYFVLLPYGLEYLVSYLDPELAVANVTLTAYFKFVASLTLLMGFVFELPLVMWAVARAGLVGARTLSKSRRIAILMIAVFAAVMTPPDVVSMLLVSVPMIGLYEVGLLLARMADSARARADARRL